MWSATKLSGPIAAATPSKSVGSLWRRGRGSSASTTWPELSWQRPLGSRCAELWHSESYKDFKRCRMPAAPPLVSGIELRHAVQTAVSTLFGLKWVAQFRAGEISCEISAKGGKESRERRWSIVRLILVRALKRNRIRSWVSVNGEVAEPLAGSCWGRNDGQSRPGLVDVLGKRDVPVFWLETSDFKNWLGGLACLQAAGT